MSAKDDRQNRDDGQGAGSGGTTTRPAPGRATLTQRLPANRRPSAPDAAAEGAREPAALVEHDDPFAAHLPPVQRKEAGAAPAAEAAAPTAAGKSSAAAKSSTLVARQFLAEFEPVLSAFPELPKKPTAKPIDPNLILANWDDFYANNQKEVAWLEEVAVELRKIFSSKQLELLGKFHHDRIIPEGLFTNTKVTDADAMGTVMGNASQRILMASHILAKGRTVNADAADSAAAPGKVQADNCGQWNEYVWIYAACNSSGSDPGGFEGTIKNSEGPTGKTSFGGGGPNQFPYGSASGKVTAANKKEADETGVETLDSGGGPGRKDPLGAPNPDKMFEALSSLQPGDWVWIDNRGDADGHSFIFVSWATPPVKGSFIGADGKAVPTAAGVCNAYSQRANGNSEAARKKKYGDWAADGGGDAHTQPVGYPFSNSPQRYPVTQICRPAKDAGPARTEEQLLHFNRATAATKNQGFIKQLGLDLAKYHAEMVKAGNAAVAAAADDYEEGLEELCESVLKKHAGAATLEDLTVLIALVQRMNPTDAVLNKKKSGLNGRPVRGWLDPAEKTDIELVPGGLAAIK